jgi:hypothetical protein
MLIFLSLFAFAIPLLIKKAKKEEREKETRVEMMGDIFGIAAAIIFK